MKKKLFNLFRLTLTCLLLLLLFSRVEFFKLKVSFDNLDVKLFILGLSYFLLYPLVGIARWQKMINYKYDLSFKLAAKVYYIGESINLLLPAKAGDVSKAFYLNKLSEVSIGYGTSSVIFEKLLDLLSICFLFLIGWFFHEIILFEQMFFLFGFIFFIIFLFVLFLFIDKISFFKIITRKLNSSKLLSLISEFQLFSTKIKSGKSRLLLFIIVSIFFWLGHCGQIYIFFKAVNINISYMDTIFIMPITFIISLLPFTIAGFGTREATLMILLSGYASNENILAGSILISLRYFIPAFIGLFFWKNIILK